MNYPTAYEANFDGLVGPTHHFGGLAHGNLASAANHQQRSHPKRAALQGLAKMRAMLDLGYVQGILPPQSRPDTDALRRLGFHGNDREVLEQAAAQAPSLLGAVSSAAGMWVANAATVSASADTQDGRVHFTPANLNSAFHRSLEHPSTARALKAIFNDPMYFMHHEVLPETAAFGDEGAANHTRLGAAPGVAGVEMYVYGRRAFDRDAPAPQRYPARQTLEASQAVARLHGIDETAVVFAQQHPDTIDQGVFHNDVIAVGTDNVLFYHQDAFLDSEQVMQALDTALTAREVAFTPVEVPRARISVAQAVSTYLFNSQLLRMPNGKMRLIVPEECMEDRSVRAYLNELVAGVGPIAEVRAFDLRESMRNGGGPACLRLRVQLNEEELQALNPAALLTPERHATLEAWVERHYRDRLDAADLADPALLDESRTALDELTRLLSLGSIYDFQRN